MVVLLTTASLEEQHLAKSFFNTGLLGAAGSSGPSDDQFNRVSFLSHFDGANNGVNNAFDDGSANNYTVTAAGNVTQGSFGPFARPDGEWGWDFDSDDYLTTPYSSDFNFGTGSFTIEAFVFLKDLSGIQGIYATSAGANPVPKWVMFLDDATPKIHINALNSSGSIYMNATSDLTVGTWNHIAYVRNGSTWYWFINGTQAGTGSNSTNITFSNSEPTYIGYGGESYFTAINGFISNLRVVNGTALYTSNFTAPTSALTAVTNTKLLTCQSNRFIDNSASGHTLTPTGNPAVTAFGPFLTSKVYNPAVNGASAYFDGTADALSIASSPISASGNFTLEGWVYPNTTAESAVVGQYQGRSTGRMIITTQNGNLIFFQNGVTGGQATVAPKQWAHFVLQRTGSNIAFYVNGTRILNNSAANIAQDYLVIGTEDVNSGNYPNTMDGYISNIRITSSAVYSEGTSITVPTAPYSTVTNTNFLLNMADGQAIDSAAQNNLTLIGNTDTSTAQKKFGTASLFYDGSGDGAYYANGAALGTGDWTIETFLWVNDFDASLGVFQYGGADGALGSLILTNQKIRVLSSNVAARLDTSGTINAQTWYHVAYVSYNGTIKVYINGTADSTTFDASSTTWTFTDTNVYVGARYYSSAVQAPFDGYLDEFRVSHFARYTSNFTAPTKAFADKGQ